MFKKLVYGLFFLSVIFSSIVLAQNEGTTPVVPPVSKVTPTDVALFNITVKQGFIMPWEDQTVQNATLFETIKTKPIDSWGKWNVLLDGWSLDAGFGYDAKGVKTATVLIGRNFGTLGKYLPLDFPLKDKISLTLYPIGLYVKNPTDHPTFSPCSGGALLKAEIKF